MSIGSVLHALGDALDSAEIPWMVAGSVASSTCGEVRSNQDIDLVVVATRTSLVRPFSRAEFDRRRRAIIDGVEVWVAAPEDVLLAKLEWSKATGSERQLRDAAGIVAVQGEALDGEWLSRWAKELGVEAELARVWPGRDLP